MPAHRRQPVVVDGADQWACTKCKEVKPPSDFSKNLVRVNGLNSYCRACLVLIEATRKNNPKHIVTRRRCSNRWYMANKLRQKENNRLWKAGNKNRLRKYKAEWDTKNKHGQDARNAINMAIRKGLIVRPATCELCPSGGAIEGHHPTYEPDRWLLVTWMCIPCHRWTHARLRDQRRKIWV